MILKRLVEYYDLLAADPTDPMTPFGFSREKISFAVLINADGSEPELSDLRVQDGSKIFPRILPVPYSGGRSGTGLKPNFLWDNSGYVLGADSKGKPERTRRAFEAFREFHEEVACAVDDEGLAAVVKFLTHWLPDRAATLPLMDEAKDKNLVFRIRGKMEFVHESPAVQQWWTRYGITEEEMPIGQSLISGDAGPIARLHPLISGIAGAQSTGAAIASFNADAYESYGHEQTFNAPVSVVDAFKHTTALNRLLEGRAKRMSLGDATVVFWAGRNSRIAEIISEIFAEVPPLARDTSGESKKRAEEVKLFLSQLRGGHAGADAIDSDDDTPFYILGLSPNASRISIRFWVDTTVGGMKDRLARHMSDLREPVQVTMALH